MCRRYGIHILLACHVFVISSLEFPIEFYLMYNPGMTRIPINSSAHHYIYKVRYLLHNIKGANKASNLESNFFKIK